MNISLDYLSGLGERPFLVHQGRSYSYADLAGEVERLCESIPDRGIRTGEVVALTGPYNFAAIAWFLTLARNRNIVVPLVGSDSMELDARIGEAGAEVVVEIEKTGDRGQETGDRGQETGGGRHWLIQQLGGQGRAGLILFSSGSTGKPKAMLHDLDTLMGSYRIGKPKDLRVLAFMGMDHIGGLDILLRAVSSGSCLVIPKDRSPEAICRLIEGERVSVLPATPTFLNLMLMSEAYRGRDLGSLKIIGFGAERMPAAVLHRLREVFPNVSFQQKFGTSETNAVRTVSKESDPLWMKVSDENVEVKIVEGELWLKTPSRILGYINHETDRLTSDGWYRTGDLVEVGEDGFFRIIGRRESVINVGGEKVVPGEVETIIRELPQVHDARVYAIANPIMGQVVGAEIVVEKDSIESEVVREVRRICRERLVPHKVPVKIKAVPRIEVNARFKKKA